MCSKIAMTIYFMVMSCAFPLCSCLPKTKGFRAVVVDFDDYLRNEAMVEVSHRTNAIRIGLHAMDFGDDVETEREMDGLLHTMDVLANMLTVQREAMQAERAIASNARLKAKLEELGVHHVFHKGFTVVKR